MKKIISLFILFMALPVLAQEVSVFNFGDKSFNYDIEKLILSEESNGLQKLYYLNDVMVASVYDAGGDGNADIVLLFDAKGNLTEEYSDINSDGQYDIIAQLNADENVTNLIKPQAEEVKTAENVVDEKDAGYVVGAPPASNNKSSKTWIWISSVVLIIIIYTGFRIKIKKL